MCAVLVAPPSPSKDLQRLANLHNISANSSSGSGSNGGLGHSSRYMLNFNQRISPSKVSFLDHFSVDLLENRPMFLLSEGRAQAIKHLERPCS